MIIWQAWVEGFNWALVWGFRFLGVFSAGMGVFIVFLLLLAIAGLFIKIAFPQALIEKIKKDPNKVPDKIEREE